MGSWPLNFLRSSNVQNFITSATSGLSRHGLCSSRPADRHETRDANETRQAGALLQLVRTSRHTLQNYATASSNESTHKTGWMVLRLLFQRTLHVFPADELEKIIKGREVKEIVFSAVGPHLRHAPFVYSVQSGNTVKFRINSWFPSSFLQVQLKPLPLFPTAHVLGTSHEPHLHVLTNSSLFMPGTPGRNEWCISAGAFPTSFTKSSKHL